MGRYRQIQDQTEERYNLRPRTTLEEQFSFIQEKRLDEPSDIGLPSDDNKIKLSKSDKNREKLYKGKPCKYVQTKYIPNQSAKPSKSILKTSNSENTMSLMESLKDSLSADLLHSFMVGIQLSIQEILEPKNIKVREKNNLTDPQFLLYKARQILAPHKKGQIILTLSNKLSINNLPQKQGIRMKKIKIIEKPQVSHYNEDEEDGPLFLNLTGEEFTLLTNSTH